jgi:hypothetical protein
VYDFHIFELLAREPLSGQKRAQWFRARCGSGDKWILFWSKEGKPCTAQEKKTVRNTSATIISVVNVMLADVNTKVARSIISADSGA